jgi:hypothetical protein
MGFVTRNDQRIYLSGILGFFAAALLFLPVCVAEDSEYQLGHGLVLSKALTLGGYFSLEYANGEKSEEFVVDDLAVLAYGSITDRLTYFVEIESVGLYRYDFDTRNSDSSSTPAIERLYGDFMFNDYLSIRLGKQITPIGYWNLQPINVLRETTSNPRYSRELFPKFLSGLDVYGYTPFIDTLAYHVWFQATEDLDSEYINIDIDSHYGVTLNKSFEGDWQMGAGMGMFSEVAGPDTRYLQFNARIDKPRFSVFTEAVFDFRKTEARKNEKAYAVYLQGEYRFNPKHTAIARGEHFSDDRTGEKEDIGVLGYSFRPRYPISMKLEYQWHTDNSDNQLLGSFSVLF